MSVREFVLVPIVREKSRHIVVVAEMSGQPARMVIDTGAGGTVIDAGAVERLWLKLSKASRKGGGVGSVAMRLNYVAKHDLKIADLDLSDIKLLTLDLSHVNAGLKRAGVEPVVGVIGADVLFRRQAVIDYSRGIMILSR